MAGQGAFRAVIVDGWPMLRLGVAKVVDDAGGRVVAEAADAAAGISAVRTHRPDVLVLGDHAGAAADGAGLVALIKDAARIVPDMHCLALVNGLGPDELRHVLTAGIGGLLPRSVDPGELRDALTRVAAGDRVVSPQVIAAMFGASRATATAGGGGGGSVEGVVSLTSKERQVLALLTSGRSNAEIASALFVSAATVKTHLGHIYDKLGVRSRYEALSLAVALGMVG